MRDVTFSQALIVTLVSMIVVFIVLIIISYAIGILKALGQSNKKEEKLEVDKSNIVEETKEKEINDDEEFLAVIAAALAASMGVEIPDIKISKIKRLENSTWNNTARLEQMN